MPFLMIKEIYKCYNPSLLGIGLGDIDETNVRMLTVVEARWWVHEVSWFYLAYFVFLFEIFCN